MNRQPDIIGMYANLSLQADRFLAAGQQPPAQIMMALNAIETRARATMTQQQFAAAEHHMYVAKNQLIQQANHNRTQYTQRQIQRSVEQGVRKVTRGMAGQAEGLSPAQFQALLHGRPIPGNPRITQAQRDEAFRARTARVDPTGRGWTEKEWTDRLNHLADADAKEFQQLSKEYRADPQQLRQAASSWSEERVVHELQRRRAERDKPSEEIRANDDDIRRADVIAAYGEQAFIDNRPDYMDGVTNDSTPNYMAEEEGRRGDVARAWDAVEETGD